MCLAHNVYSVKWQQLLCFYKNLITNYIILGKLHFFEPVFSPVSGDNAYIADMVFVMFH